MALYKDKYSVESARANWWNYGWAGAYFITICTKNRNHNFGEITTALDKNKMILSHCGVIADILWHQIPYHAKNIELGAFHVMPNHIHGILILTEDSEIGLRQYADDEAISRFQNQGKNTVSSIIGSYKSAVTNNSNRLEFKNGWQGKFHDHIIRDDQEYQRINNYIESNVQNWKQDRFY